MGILRIYLAACVLAAHSEQLFPWSVHGGESAVGIFFVISGFYMQLILSSDRYPGAMLFYISRGLRIYLPYIVCCALCLASGLISWAACGNGLTIHRYLEDQGSSAFRGGIESCVMISNLTVFFQDLVLFADLDSNGNLCLTRGVARGAEKFYTLLVVPQGWSIAVELQFYLLSPWLVRRMTTTRLCFLMVLFSCLRAAATLWLKADFDPWTYRCSPFELPKFLAGMVGCRILWQTTRGRRMMEHVSSALRRLPQGMQYPIAILTILLLMRVHLGGESVTRHAVNLIGPLVKEPMLLLNVMASAVLIPVCFCLTLPFASDRRIGELSFPIYLLHLTVVLALEGPLNGLLPSPDVLGESSLVISVIVALLLQKAFLDRIETNRQIRITGG